MPLFILLLTGHFLLNTCMFMSSAPVKCLVSGMSLPHVPFTEATEDRCSGSLYPDLSSHDTLSFPCRAEISCGCCPRVELFRVWLALWLAQFFLQLSCFLAGSHCCVWGCLCILLPAFGIILLCVPCHLNRFKMVTCDFNFLLSDRIFVYLLFSGFLLIELPVCIFRGDYVACSFVLTSSFFVFF